MKNRAMIFITWTSILLSSCTKFLDKEPLSTLIPDQYLTNESNISSYAINLYSIFPTHEGEPYGVHGVDRHTDNMAAMTPDAIYAPGYKLVPQAGGAWDFGFIYSCNFFFDNVLPNLEAGEIEGNAENINHYIGEVYFLRAFAYFNKLMQLGDFPIIEKNYTDDLGELTEVSKRAPRNEVARFILADLDRAIGLMKEVAPSGGKNRLCRDVAYLFKSRVALYEATWLKYFKGTAFVPNGNGWPGATKEYLSGYQYPAGGIDQEINFFLEEAIASSRVVAEKYVLVNNTGQYQANPTDPVNPYFNMFGDTDMNGYSEVLLWRQFNFALGVSNNVAAHASKGNNGIGTTKSMVDAFLMADGAPIYASSSYQGDRNFNRVLSNRDTRARLFIKTPGRRNLHTAAGTHGEATEPCPRLVATSNELRYTTGYAIAKGLNFDGKYTDLNRSEVGSIVFRAVEAYLNYIEAYYERHSALDALADRLWKDIRRRAHVNEDYNFTIGLTNMAIEAQTDWGAYSSGNLISPTLYNIRRERRCEFMGDGMRMMDLKRWRSMDQMINTPYHVLGINLWEEMGDTWACFSNVVEGVTVSPRTFSKYLAPYHVLSNNIVYNGYRWHVAHYLEPIAIQHFLITSTSGDLQSSPIYQNPGWSLDAGSGPTN